MDKQTILDQVLEVLAAVNAPIYSKLEQNAIYITGSYALQKMGLLGRNANDLDLITNSQLSDERGELLFYFQATLIFHFSLFIFHFKIWTVPQQEQFHSLTY